MYTMYVYMLPGGGCKRQLALRAGLVIRYEMMYIIVCVCVCVCVPNAPQN